MITTIANHRPRAGAASTESIVLLLSVLFPVFVYITIFTRNLLRHDWAVVHSLDRGRPEDAKRVHMGRDYEQIMDRKESFPWLYDLTEQGNDAHAGETWAGARMRNQDGTVTVLEGMNDLKGSRELQRNQTYKEASTWGEDNPMDDTAHTVGVSPEGNRWLEGDMKLRHHVTEGPAGAGRAGSDGSFAGGEGRHTWLEGEGKMKIAGEEVDVKARMGGLDYAAGAGKSGDEGNETVGLQAGVSGVGLEVELRKNLYRDESRPNGAQVDLVGKLSLGKVAANAGIGSTQFMKDGQEHKGYGFSAGAEADVFEVGLGLEAKSGGVDVPFVGEYRAVGSIGVKGGFGASAHVQALLETGKNGGVQYKQEQGIGWGLNGSLEYAVGVEPVGK